MDNININQCIITITRNCNLRCRFCYAKKTGYIENELIKYDNIKKIVDFCSSAKINFIVLTGGEPTLYPNILDIIKYIKNQPHKMIVAIATNGIKLENFSYCKEIIDHGVDYIDISLKGKNEKECYEIVGKECFSQQMKAIYNLSVLPVEFICSMVLTCNNINTFCEGIEIAYNNGARQFSFTFALDNEKSNLKDFEYLQQNNPFVLIKSFVSQIDKLNTITKGEWWIEYSFPMCIYTKKQLSLLEGRLAAPCHIFKRNSITFDEKMNLLPCGMHIESKMGQFGIDFSSYKEFKDIIKCDPYKSIMDSLSKLPSNYCLSCKHLKLCFGGCSIFWKNCSFESLKKFKEFNGYNFNDF